MICSFWYFYDVFYCECVYRGFLGKPFWYGFPQIPVFIDEFLLNLFGLFSQMM